MPIFFANSAFVLIASFFKSCNRAGNTCLGALPLVYLQSIMPVRETPSSLSSSQFFFHVLEIYRKFVSVDCSVPRIAASLTFFFRVSGVSSALTTTSDRLQNSRSLSIISEQGLVPNSSPSVCLRPLAAAIFTADSRLNIPRSPDLES